MNGQNNVEKMKSAWNIPVLTVLVRNNPEESVLTACKMRGVTAGPGNVAISCSNEPSVAYCVSCANLSSS